MPGAPPSGQGTAPKRVWLASEGRYVLVGSPEHLASLQRSNVPPGTPPASSIPAAGSQPPPVAAPSSMPTGPAPAQGTMDFHAFQAAQGSANDIAALKTYLDLGNQNATASIEKYGIGNLFDLPSGSPQPPPADPAVPPPPGSTLGPPPTGTGPPILNPNPPPLLNPETPARMFGQATPYPQLGGMFAPRPWQQAAMFPPAQAPAQPPGQPPAQPPGQPAQGQPPMGLPWQMQQPEIPEFLKKRLAAAQAFQLGPSMLFGG